MLRKVLCAVAILGFAVGLTLAEEITGRITKIDDKKVTVVTGKKTDKKTTEYDLAKDCKFCKMDKDAKVELKDDAKVTLDSALNYSLLFEVPSGRPDRNSQKVLKKAQLNPLLSPRWGLSIGRRGDLSLGKELCGAIFGPGRTSEFDVLLKALDSRWNNPFKKPEPDSQSMLF